MSDEPRSGAIRILIADDHALVRKGLRQILLETYPEEYEVGEARDGLQALEMALNGEWDVIILDITMPGATGLQVLKAVKQAKPAVPVVMLSMHASPVYVQNTLSLGASAYLTKEAAPDELVSALRTVLAGRKYISGFQQGDEGNQV